jgi:hypothetical protein
MGHIFFGDVVEHGGSHALPEIRNCCQMEFWSDPKTYFPRVLVFDIDVAIYLLSQQKLLLITRKYREGHTLSEGLQNGCCHSYAQFPHSWSPTYQRCYMCIILRFSGGDHTKNEKLTLDSAYLKVVPPRRVSYDTSFLSLSKN